MSCSLKSIFSLINFSKKYHAPTPEPIELNTRVRKYTNIDLISGFIDLPEDLNVVHKVSSVHVKKIETIRIIVDLTKERVRLSQP